MNFKFDPTKTFTFFLALLVVLEIIFKGFSQQILLHLASTLGFALVLYFVFRTLSGKNKSIWNTVITSLIIFLILDYGTALADLIFPILAVLIAMGWKFFFSWKGSPLINPAVLGLLVLALISFLLPVLDKTQVTWHGASFEGYLSLAVVAGWMIFGLQKWRKWPAVLAFLLCHALILVIRGFEPATLAFIFSDSTIYFFASFMLVEPKTSPFLTKEQILFGICSAIFLNLALQFGAPYAELLAIACGNLLFAGMKILNMRKKTAVAGTLTN